MIRGLDQLLASRKAFIDATASREIVSEGKKNVKSPINNDEANGKTTTTMGQQQLITKQEHGFVGLFNQGATCYLNSFVQSLYMLPSFRRGVFAFRLPANVQPSSSVAHQLQQLFFRLSYGTNGATSTSGLTKSFGWGMEEVFQQQDVQELFQKLFEAMQASVKGWSDQKRRTNDAHRKRIEIG